MQVEKTPPTADEVLAQEIRKISADFRKLLAGPLNEKALVLLVGHQCKVSAGTVRLVVNAVAGLDKAYLKPPKEKKA